MSDDKPDEQPKTQAEPEIVSTFATRKSRKKQPPYAPILIGGVAVVIVGAAGFYVLRDAKAEVGSVIVEGDGVNCRAGPGLTDPSLTKFDRGTSLRVLKIEGGWYQVEHSPEPCWVTATLVSFTPAEPAAPEQRGPEVFQLRDEIDPMSDARVVSAVAQIETQTGSIAELTISCTNGADLSTRFASYNAPSDNEQMSGLSLESTVVTDYGRMQYVEQWFIDARLDDVPAQRFTCLAGSAGCRYNNMVSINIEQYLMTDARNRSRANPSRDNPYTAGDGRGTDQAVADRMEPEIQALLAEYPDLTYADGAIRSRLGNHITNQRTNEAQARLNVIWSRVRTEVNSASEEHYSRVGNEIQNEVRSTLSEWRFANMTVRYSAGGMQNTVQFPMQDSAVRTVLSACPV